MDFYSQTKLQRAAEEKKKLGFLTNFNSPKGYTAIYNPDYLIFMESSGTQ